jgi:hypothetical protein
MGIYDNFADAPNAIVKEGREITLKYERGANNTAIISWNIPAPAAGCGSDFQGAYDGIVITVTLRLQIICQLPHKTLHTIHMILLRMPIYMLVIK